MKKTFLMLSGVAIAVFSLIYFPSCNKKDSNVPAPSSVKSNNTDNPFSPSDYKSALAIQDSINTFYTDERRKHNIFKKIWNWIQAHTGTSWGTIDCGGTSPCGPCPGICLGMADQALPIDSVQALTFPINSDSGVFVVEGVTTTSMIVRFQDSDAFVKEDTFFVPQNTNLGSVVADSLGVASLTILKGVYPMVTASNGYRETQVGISLR